MNGDTMYTRRQYGAELIAVERQRQINEEGWTREHDDEHGNGSLVRAAMLYALVSSGIAGRVKVGWTEFDLHGWLKSRVGWGPGWFKPDEDDPIRNLVKAGALIAAEIDRLQRT